VGLPVGGSVAAIGSGRQGEGDVFVVHATEALRAKLKTGAAVEVPDSTTSLGAWYANVLRWRSPVVVFVNEATLLPVLLPLTPARTLVERFPAAFAQVVLALGTAQWFVEAEVAQMSAPPGN
jgi:hypothetical protein